MLNNIVTIDLLYLYKKENTRPHSATFTPNWFTRNHVTVMEWPSASPDLNIIEMFSRL